MPLANILKHILDETDYLRATVSGLQKDDFLADETLKRAFVRSLEIIGEAVKQIPEERRAQEPLVNPRQLFVAPAFGCKASLLCTTSGVTLLSQVSTRLFPTTTSWPAMLVSQR